MPINPMVAGNAEALNLAESTDVISAFLEANAGLFADIQRVNSKIRPEVDVSVSACRLQGLQARNSRAAMRQAAHLRTRLAAAEC